MKENKKWEEKREVYPTGSSENKSQSRTREKEYKTKKKQSMSD